VEAVARSARADDRSARRGDRREAFADAVGPLDRDDARPVEHGLLEADARELVRLDPVEIAVQETPSISARIVKVGLTRRRDPEPRGQGLHERRLAAPSGPTSATTIRAARLSQRAASARISSIPSARTRPHGEPSPTRFRGSRTGD
jgi:hypothetical protein